MAGQPAPVPAPQPGNGGAADPTASSGTARVCSPLLAGGPADSRPRPSYSCPETGRGEKPQQRHLEDTPHAPQPVSWGTRGLCGDAHASLSERPPETGAPSSPAQTAVPCGPGASFSSQWGGDRTPPGVLQVSRAAVFPP